MAEHRFTFTTSGDDASNISIALDFYIRVLIGQFQLPTPKRVGSSTLY